MLLIVPLLIVVLGTGGQSDGPERFYVEQSEKHLSKGRKTERAGLF